MSEAIELCALIYPDPSKLSRTREVLIDTCNEVKEHSEGITRYACYESIEDEKPVFIFFERYENPQALEEHRKDPSLAKAFKIAEEEALLAKPRKMLMMKRVAGWLEKE